MSMYYNSGKSNEVVALYAMVSGLLSFIAGFGLAVAII